ncbi:MAG: glycosyltransferase family 39 protein, partial [archaeon]
MEKSRQYILYILIFSLAIRLALISLPTEIWWDEATYIGIGKYLLSGGTSGFIEYLRPLLLPAILGIAWKINIDPITTGRLFAILSSIATIYMTYLIAKKIDNEKSGIIAAAILSVTYYFINFSTKIITDIPSILFILIATNELLNKNLTKKNIITAGISSALAILMRYTSMTLIIPIILGITIISLKRKEKEKYRQAISDLATFLASFGMTLTPYFIYMYMKYNDPFFSMSQAMDAVNITKIYYGTSIINIIQELITQNPLLIFSILGIYLYAKNIDNKKAIILAELAMTAISLYVIPIKILRYTLMILPFLCITAGTGIHELSKRTQASKSTERLKNINITAIFIATNELLNKNLTKK